MYLRSLMPLFFKIKLSKLGMLVVYILRMAEKNCGGPIRGNIRGRT
jgi:hypothetical protein